MILPEFTWDTIKSLVTRTLQGETIPLFFCR